MKKIFLVCVLILQPYRDIEANSLGNLILGTACLGGSVYTAKQAMEEYNRTQNLKNKVKGFFGDMKERFNDEDDFPKERIKRELLIFYKKAESHLEKYARVYGWGLTTIVLFHIAFRMLVS